MESKHTVKTICKYCRREFASFNLQKVCSDCEKRMDEKFAAIRNYLYENPDAQVGEICQALDIPTALVKYYLKEERLIIKKGTNLFLKCEGCGVAISSGRFCRECEITAVRDQMSGKLGKSVDVDTMDREISAFHLTHGRSNVLKDRLRK